MTTLPNALTTTINHERSPVLLTTEDECATWLTGSTEEAFGVIKTSDPMACTSCNRGSTRKI
jgi:putative SOS response-associated peptidase YedK